MTQRNMEYKVTFKTFAGNPSDVKSLIKHHVLLRIAERAALDDVPKRQQIELRHNIIVPRDSAPGQHSVEIADQQLHWHGV